MMGGTVTILLVCFEAAVLVRRESLDCGHRGRSPADGSTSGSEQLGPNLGMFRGSEVRGVSRSASLCSPRGPDLQNPHDSALQNPRDPALQNPRECRN